MDLHSHKNTRDATHLLYSSRSRITLETTRQEPCLRKLLGHVSAFEQVSDYFHGQQSSHSRQEALPDASEELAYDEATRKAPELCSASAKTKSPSGVVISEEEVNESDGMQ
jgi:hypothetical protein